MTSRTTWRHALLAAVWLPALIPGSGCDKTPAVPGAAIPANFAKPSIRQKAFKVVKVVAKKLIKYNPVGIVIDVVDLVLQVRAIVNGSEEVIDSIQLTPDEARSLREGGVLEITDGEGKSYEFKPKGK